MRKPLGYAFLTDRKTGQIIKEADTFTCSHCSKVVHVGPKCDPADLGGHCKACDKLICPGCAYKMAHGAVCATWVARIDRLDDRLRFVHNERERIKLFDQV